MFQHREKKYIILYYITDMYMHEISTIHCIFSWQIFKQVTALRMSFLVRSHGARTEILCESRLKTVQFDAGEPSRDDTLLGWAFDFDI